MRLFLCLVLTGSTFLGACSIPSGEQLPPTASPGAGGETASSGTGGTGEATSGGAEASGGAVPTGSGGTGSAWQFCKEGAAERIDIEQLEPYELPPEASPAADASAGTVSAVQDFPSGLYADLFPYRVYVPAVVDPETPLGLMVFQDGSLYLDQFKVNVVFDTLIADGAIPPMIGLFIDAPAGGEQRRVEVYDSPTDLYTRFLVEEIIPQVVTAQFNVTRDPDGWATVGFSAGGTQAMAALLLRSAFFHKSLQTNSSFLAWKENGVDLVTLVPRVPGDVSLRVNLLSSENDLSDDRGDWLSGNLEMAAALSDAGHSVRMVQGTGGHYPPTQGIEDFPNALRWLWSNCKGDP